MNNLLEKNKITIIELLILTLIWLIVFISPVVIQISDQEIDWKKVFDTWARLSSFLILSLLNHFVLYPLFFVKRRKYWYLILSVFTLFIFSSILHVIQQPLNRVNFSGLLELDPGLISSTMAVPASVPSLFHNSESFAPSVA